MNVIQIIVEEMNKVERFDGYNGFQKKEYVKNSVELFVKASFGKEYWQKYEPIIDDVIEFVVSISKKELEIHINEIKQHCAGCFSFC